MRRRAALLADEASRLETLEIANLYEKLAERADERAAAPRPPDRARPANKIPEPTPTGKRQQKPLVLKT